MGEEHPLIYAARLARQERRSDPLDQSPMEATDAAYEDAQGRLPGQPGYAPRRRP